MSTTGITYTLTIVAFAAGTLFKHIHCDKGETAQTEQLEHDKTETPTTE